MVEDQVKHDSDYRKVRISIWKLDPVYDALMINSQDITFKSDLHIYKNTI